MQERVQTAAAGKPFVINVTGSATKFLVTEGIDLIYGVRPLKHAIERLLIQPIRIYWQPARFNPMIGFASHIAANLGP